MTEHDNTNKGAAFTPWSDQQFILQGDLDCDATQSLFEQTGAVDQNNQVVINQLYRERELE